MLETENFCCLLCVWWQMATSLKNCPLCKCFHSPQSRLSANKRCMYTSVPSTIHSLIFCRSLFSSLKEDEDWIWVCSWNLSLELTSKQLYLNAYYSFLFSSNFSNTEHNPVMKGFHGILLTMVGTLIVATIYLQLIQNRYMFRSFTVLQCSHQHCVQPVANDVEVVGCL